MPVQAEMSGPGKLPREPFLRAKGKYFDAYEGALAITAQMYIERELQASAKSSFTWPANMVH